MAWMKREDSIPVARSAEGVDAQVGPEGVSLDFELWLTESGV